MRRNPKPVCPSRRDVACTARALSERAGADTREPLRYLLPPDALS